MDIDAMDAKIHRIEAFLHRMGPEFREFIAERGAAGSPLGVGRLVDPRPAAQARRSETLTGDAATDRMVEEQRVREQRRIDQQRAKVEQASHGLPVYAPTELERLAAEQGAAEAASGAREAERSRMNVTAVDRPASSTQREVEAGRPAVGQTVDPLTEPLRGMS